LLLNVGLRPKATDYRCQQRGSFPVSCWLFNLCRF